ncbi:MAG: pyrimidine/purine nucleoside phosphorylase [Marinilabiliales bacterium]
MEINQKPAFRVNEYYAGKVKSISLQTLEGPMTIGVMAEGKYEFETASIEEMTVTSGEMLVMLPDEKDYKLYKPYETFVVEKNKVFQVIIEKIATYKCLYK